MSNTALAIPWLLSLSAFPAFLVLWLGNGEQFFVLVVFRENEGLADYPLSES